jgi:RNA polymerase sigma-70 factor (ECF subfamily)
MTDDEIIGRVLAGDLNCFRLIVEKYQTKIVGMIFNMTRDHHLSEDLGQEVFLAVYQNLGAFDSARSRFSTWIYRIAKNKTLNALKKKRPVLLREMPDTAGPENVHDDVVSAEFNAEFDQLLAQMPVRQRLAFVWAEIEQLSYQDISEIEGISIGAVKSLVSRARQYFQEALRDRKANPDE